MFVSIMLAHSSYQLVSNTGRPISLSSTYELNKLVANSDMLKPTAQLPNLNSPVQPNPA
jgi:hypothetical protein